MKKKLIVATLILLSASNMNAQTLEKMNWFNEPAQWSVSGNRLTMAVTPKSDYWRISHYGFTD